MTDKNSPLGLVERRLILKALGASLVLPNWVLGENSLWVPDDLAVTPQQTEGPFYPQPTIDQALFNDTDLTRKLGDHEIAKGQLAIVEGTIRNQKGAPQPGAIVEIWQACASGRYNHSRDKNNPALLDNNFQFWGRAVSGEQGKYSFSTILPGKYPGRNGRHIHFRVDADGYKRCSTQCYFSDFGNDNMRDGIYTKLTPEERKLVTVEFDKPSAKKGSNSNPNSSHVESSTTAESTKPKTETQTERAGMTIQAQSAIWKGQFDIVLAKS